MKRSERLPITAYLVLSLLAEGEAHGYELQRMVHDRGFRFWTDINRSSIYNSLKRLEAGAWVTSELRAGGGPAKRVFGITQPGLERLRSESLRYLSEPRHPRNELDLGVLGLPYLDPGRARAAVEEGVDLLAQREAFVAERRQWCTERRMELPAQNFERPLNSIASDRTWLSDLQEWLGQQQQPPAAGEWQSYEYEEPPYVDKEDP